MEQSIEICRKMNYVIDSKYMYIIFDGSTIVYWFCVFVYMKCNMFNLNIWPCISMLVIDCPEIIPDLMSWRDCITRPALAWHICFFHHFCWHKFFTNFCGLKDQRKGLILCNFYELKSCQAYILCYLPFLSMYENERLKVKY